MVIPSSSYYISEYKILHNMLRNIFSKLSYELTSELSKMHKKIRDKEIVNICL